MIMPTADEHYEAKFEFPLWKLIKQRAQEKDICYLDAAWEVIPEYGKGIRYRDKAFEDACIDKRQEELEAQREEGRRRGVERPQR
jgi:hypothetical protein